MFYLFFPLTCVLLLRWRRGLWLWVALLAAFIVMDPFSKTAWTTNDLWRENTYLGGMGAIALGCLTAVLTAYLERRPPSRAWLFSLRVSGTLLILWITFWPRWQWLRPAMHRIAVSATDDLILPLGVCLFILATVLRGHRGSRVTAPLRWFGRHSYELYLTHEFLVIWGVELYDHIRPTHNPGPLALWFIAILLLCAPFAWLVARFFSEPMNRRLRGALPPR